MLVFIIALILISFISGGLARWALPGPDPMGIAGTIAVGLAGTFLGGLLAWFLLGHAGGFIFAVVGSVIVLALYRKFVQHRPLTGPGARNPPS